MGEGLGDGQGGGMGGTNFPLPAPFNLSSGHFSYIFLPALFPPPVHLPPSFLPEVPNFVHLHPYTPPPSKATSDQGCKQKKVEMTNIKINRKVFCESRWFKEIFNC